MWSICTIIIILLVILAISSLRAGSTEGFVSWVMPWWYDGGWRWPWRRWRTFYRPWVYRSVPYGSLYRYRQWVPRLGTYTYTYRYGPRRQFV